MAPTDKAKLKRPPTEKQPKARVARYLKSQEAQINEGVKNALLLKGTRCSQHMFQVLKDLRAVKAPAVKMLSKNNDIHPFEDATSIEFLSTKNDCSLFAIASINKKRPDNLIFGRTFDNALLDMVEVGVTNFRGLRDYPGAPKKRVGSKPMFLFVGDLWSNDEKYKKLQNLLLDWFRGDPVDSLALAGLDHCITVTASSPPSGSASADATPPVVHFRSYFVKLKKDPKGGNVPVPLLTNSGPDMDLTIRRTQFASNEQWKNALKLPKELKSKKLKNRKTNAMGEVIGKIHLERQDIDGGLKGKKMKALKVAEKREKEEEKAAQEEELKREREQEGIGSDEEEEGGRGGRGRGKRSKN
jgi:ribosome production factor 2